MSLLQALLGALLIVGLLGALLAATDTRPKSPTADLANPSGRPPPTRVYLHPRKGSKKPSKPSKLPNLPRVPSPSFKSLQSPLKLPTLRIPQRK